jgi:hypothetical protein
MYGGDMHKKCQKPEEMRSVRRPEHKWEITLKSILIPGVFNWFLRKVL